MRIHSGKDKPAGAFVAVRYRAYWFWVDNGDRQSKRALKVIMFFTTLAETCNPEKIAGDNHPGAIGVRNKPNLTKQITVTKLYSYESDREGLFRKMGSSGLVVGPTGSSESAIL